MELDMQGPMGARTQIAGRERDYFSGTGYLGLQSHPQVLAAAAEALQRYGLTTGTSRGGYGEHALYTWLEAQAAAFFGVERVLYFSSGYLGSALIAQGRSAVCQRIFVDSASHFSVWDGARSSGLPVHGFAHGDADALRQEIHTHLRAGERPLIFSDGLFPISGELAPLPNYLAVAEAWDGEVALDDAHAFGVLGEHGRGVTEECGVSLERCRVCGTLSKGLGGYGGLIPGSAALLADLEAHSRVTVGASPTPLPIAAAAARALELAQDAALRQQLWQNVALARQGFRQLGWPLPETRAPILCLGVRPGLDLGRIKDELLARDICIAHVRTYSSTPVGGALRIAIFATHTVEQIERLLFEVQRLL